MATPKSPRARDMAAIHIAKKQLGLDDETYRDMLWTVGRVRSSTDLDWAGRRRVLDHLVSRGAQIGQGPIRTANEWSFIDTAATARQPLLRKICAVCRAMGVGKAYAEGVAKRQHGVDRRLEMMDGSELWRVAGALERTQRYKAKDQPPPEGGITPEGKVAP